MAHVRRWFYDGDSIPTNEKQLQLTAFDRSRWLPIVVVGLSMAMCALAFAQNKVETRWLFLDTLTAVELSGDCCHVYFGLFSNLGIMIWTAASAVCLFSAICLLKSPRVAKEYAMFASVAGIFTGWLMLDDAFLVHEKVFPAFGIPQTITILIYLALCGLYVWNFQKLLRDTRYGLLLLALGFLGASVLIDQIFHSVDDTTVVFEDTCKFVGISCWAAFHTDTMLIFLNKAYLGSTKAKTGEAN